MKYPVNTESGTPFRKRSISDKNHPVYRKFSYKAYMRISGKVFKKDRKPDPVYRKLSGTPDPLHRKLSGVPEIVKLEVIRYTGSGTPEVIRYTGSGIPEVVRYAGSYPVQLFLTYQDYF